MVCAAGDRDGRAGGRGRLGLEDRQSLVVLAGAAAVFVLPFNLLLFGLENLLFLLFPARILANQPGDFQAVGRNVLYFLAKVVALIVVAAVAGLTAVVVGLVCRSPLAGMAAAWVILAISAGLTVPLVALAFTRFDVGRDTPP